MGGAGGLRSLLSLQSKGRWQLWRRMSPKNFLLGEEKEKKEPDEEGGIVGKRERKRAKSPEALRCSSSVAHGGEEIAWRFFHGNRRLDEAGRRVLKSPRFFFGPRLFAKK